jgi:C4-dicarboxylate-specific signal transduction histidine kinase
MNQSYFSRADNRVMFTIGLGVLAAGIFVADVITPIDVSVSVLYVFVVLVASFAYSRTGIILVGLACEALTLISHLISPGEAWALWPLFDRAIGVIGIAMSTLLVVRNRMTTETLQRSEAYLAEAQQLSHTGSIGWRDPHDEQFWSRETFRIYQYEENTTKPTLAAMLTRTHPDDRAPLEQTIEKASQNRTGFELEHRLLMPNGTIRFVQFVTRATEEQAGGVRFIGAVMDITDAKRGFDELQRIQSDLARITRVTTMGQLAASIAHEINQPLTGVVTNGYTVLHWLNADTLNLDKARATAERLLRDGERASGVIQRIRGLLTKTPPQVKDVDINHLIDEALDLLQTELRLREVVVRTELAPTLPAVPGDSVQLQQVLLNLVVNGADAMSEENGQIKSLVIGSRADSSGDVLVFVRDHGVGLDQETADKIFDPFFTTKDKGMGMGLAICRSIIEAHGGRLWASAAEPRGALFQFTLPNKANADL